MVISKVDYKTTKVMLKMLGVALALVAASPSISFATLSRSQFEGPDADFSPLMKIAVLKRPSENNCLRIKAMKARPSLEGLFNHFPAKENNLKEPGLNFKAGRKKRALLKEGLFDAPSKVPQLEASAPAEMTLEGSEGGYSTVVMTSSPVRNEVDQANPILNSELWGNPQPKGKRRAPLPNLWIGTAAFGN